MLTGQAIHVPVADQSPDSVASNISTKARVLVVDDDAAVRRAITRSLLKEGHEFATAEDGQDALTQLRHGSFDVVISDVSMPNMDGIELLRHISQIDEVLPVILLSGRPTVDSALAAVRHGAVSFLPKPFAVGELLDEVKRAAKFRKVATLQRMALRVVDDGDHPLRAQLALEVRFGRALEELYMVFQPIVSVLQGGAVGYEALVRTREPSVPHPGVLLEAAEQLSRIPVLGRKIRRLCAEAVDTLPDGATMFINLHTQELYDDDLYDETSPLSVHAERVVLEITERAQLERIDGLPDRLAKLRSMGYRIAVDDIGAGYAGLTSFALLEPDVVKLDMALIRDIDSAPLRQRLVRAMATLCEELGIEMIAEGVETAAERDMVISLGGDRFQGYLYARPGVGYPVPVM